MDLSQLAKNAPSQLYPVLENILNLITSALTDINLMIRTAAAGTLRECLLLLQHRENNFRNKAYHILQEGTANFLKEKKPEFIHGYLLGIREMIMNTGTYFNSMLISIHDNVFELRNYKETYIKETFISIPPL